MVLALTCTGTARAPELILSVCPESSRIELARQLWRLATDDKRNGPGAPVIYCK